jgi:hypothetical protein
MTGTRESLPPSYAGGPLLHEKQRRQGQEPDRQKHQEAGDDCVAHGLPSLAIASARAGGVA